MKTQTEKTVSGKSNAVAHAASGKQKQEESDIQFQDRRSEVVAQSKLQGTAGNSPQARKVAQLQAIANGSAAKPVQKQGLEEEEPLQGKFETIQKQPEEEELLQGKFETIQRQGAEEEEELLQGKFETIQRQEPEEEEELMQGKYQPLQKQKNNTGLPDNLKTGMENLSGMSLDDVKVHRNSDKPAQLQAHAYAQGTDIHLGPGQEKHLPHEAWHVVQQKQRRVKPTMQMKGKVNVNDDAGLEKEADVMGAEALQIKNEVNVNAENKNLIDRSSPPVIHQLYEKDFASPSIGTEQELSSVVMHKKLADSNMIGSVKKDGKDLLDVTTDMRQSIVDKTTGGYTIEIISHPTEMNNQSAQQDRNNAFVGLIKKIEDAAGQEASLKPGEVGNGANLTVLNPDQTIYPAHEYGSGTVMSSGNQATVGVSIESIGTGEDGGKLIEAAPWYNPAFKKDIVDGEGDYHYAELAKSQNAYTYVMSGLEKFAALTKKHKLGIGDLNKESGYDDYWGGLTAPTVKNDWGMLPRSSIWGALDILTQEDRSKIREKVRNATHGSDPTISKHCFQYIVSGQSLAGHGNINDATVGGKTAALFEYRSEANMPSSLLKVFWKFGDVQEIDASREIGGAKWEPSDKQDYLRWSEESEDNKWWFYNTQTQMLSYYDTSSGLYSEEKPFDQW